MRRPMGVDSKSKDASGCVTDVGLVVVVVVVWEVVVVVVPRLG